MIVHEEVVQSQQVLQLVASSRCSAYACEFVAAAQQLGVPLAQASIQSRSLAWSGASTGKWLRSAIGRDSALTRQGAGPAEMVWAREARIKLNQWAPHDLQPCRHLSFRRCALPTKPPGRRGR